MLLRQGQQLFVSPQVRRAASNLIFADLIPDSLEVVDYLERRKAFLAKRRWLVAPGATALPALQLIGQVLAHGLSSRSRRCIAWPKKSKPAACGSGSMIRVLKITL